MEKKEPIYQMEGAFGIYHSVPESKVEEFIKQQKELEESGEIQRRLKELRQNRMEKND